MADRIAAILEEKLLLDESQKETQAPFDPAIASEAIVGMSVAVRVKVNREEVLANVATGAQARIMKTQYARQCELYGLIDARSGGVPAQGLSTYMITGRIH